MRAPAARAGWLAVGLMATIWALFSALLALNGHHPSGPSPFGRQHHYAVQALLLVPLFLLGLKLYGTIAHAGLRRAGGRAPAAETTRVLGLATGLPLLLLFVLPDIIVYAIAGFGAMGVLLPLTGPLSIVACLGAGITGAARVQGLPPASAVLPVMAGFVTLALLVTSVIR